MSSSVHRAVAASRPPLDGPEVRVDVLGVVRTERERQLHVLVGTFVER